MKGTEHRYIWKAGRREGPGTCGTAFELHRPISFSVVHRKLLPLAALYRSKYDWCYRYLKRREEM